MWNQLSIATLACLLLACSCNNKPSSTEQLAPTVAIQPERIVAIGRVEPEEKITSVGSEVNGVISKIYFHAGDSVKKGDLILEFKHEYEDARLAQAQSKFAAQNADIESVKAQINSSKVKLQNLQTRSERVKNMLEKDAETQQNYDNAKADTDQAAKEVERLTALLAEAQGRLSELAADARVAEVDVQRRRVRAPADGIILTMDITEGSTGTTTAPLFDFAPASPINVLCEVDELWAEKISKGQKAIIRTQGMDDKLGEGEVIYVSPYLKRKSLFSDDSGNMEDRRVREARIRLSGSANLLINSRVEVVIDLTKGSN